MKHPDRRRNYKDWKPTNSDFSPNVCDAPAGTTPFQEQKLKHGRLVCPLRLSLPLSPQGSSPWPPSQRQVKGKFDFQHFGQILLVCNPTEKKLLCFFILWEDVYIESLTLSFRVREKQQNQQPLRGDHLQCRTSDWGSAPCSGGGRETQRGVAQRGESDANSTPHSIPMCLNMGCQ